MKPWQTVAWRNRRAEFIKGKSCKWCKSTEYLTIEHLDPPNTLTDEDYLAFKNVIILCRKCAYARLKRMNLCPECKTAYKPRKFARCFECFKKTEEGKLFLEERELVCSEEEVPQIKVTLPCLEKVQVYEDHFEWGGIFETCRNQCPFPEREGDVQSCEDFKLWKLEEK